MDFSEVTLTFLPATNSGDSECAQITIVDDDIYEGFEEFSISISEVFPPLLNFIGGHNTLIYTIEDVNGE